MGAVTTYLLSFELARRHELHVIFKVSDTITRQCQIPLGVCVFYLVCIGIYWRCCCSYRKPMHDLSKPYFEIYPGVLCFKHHCTTRCFVTMPIWDLNLSHFIGGKQAVHAFTKNWTLLKLGALNSRWCVQHWKNVSIGFPWIMYYCPMYVDFELKRSSLYNCLRLIEEFVLTNNKMYQLTPS